jgi:hypothetical protein
MGPDRATEELAAKWSAEFGAQAAWYAAEKIKELVEWGDLVGAAKMEIVIQLIESQCANTQQTPANITKLA